jgi:hypothetical protein
MHRGHDHAGHLPDGGGAPLPHGPGHNHRRETTPPVQWQMPHRDRHSGRPPAPLEGDLDLVEAAFVQGFAAAPDPTSLLRVANVPFDAVDADGNRLVLLRVEVDSVTDIGSVMPHLGGESFRYDPLPAALVARRSRLRFVYGDGRTVRALSFAEVRMLGGERAWDRPDGA